MSARLPVPPGVGLPWKNPLQCLGATDCGWRIVNRIDLSGVGPSEVINAPNNQATVGLRWCACPATMAATAAGRRQCGNQLQFDCLQDPDAYDDPQSKWKAIQSYEYDTSSPTPPSPQHNFITGAELTVAIDSSVWNDEIVFWEFRTLSELQTYGPEHKGVEGVLWAHFVSTQATFPAFSTAELRERGNAYLPGSAFYKWSNGYFEPPKTRPSDVEVHCDDCPFLMAVPWLDPYVNPFTTRAIAGDAPIALPAMSQATKQALTAAASGELSYVKSGDLWELFPSARSDLRAGLMLDPENGRPLGEMVMSEANAQPSYEAFEDLPIAPVWAAKHGVTFSSAEGELYVFGGIENREAEMDAAVFSIEGGEWRTVELAAEEPIGEVLAATYHRPDRAVWFLRRHDGKVQLGRFNAVRAFAAGSVVQIFADFPTSWWADRDRFFMTTGPKDRIIVTMATNGGESHRSATFALVPGDIFRFLGAAQSEGGLLRIPITTSEGVLAVEQGAGEYPAHMSLVPWSDFVSDIADPPTLL